MTQGHRAAWGIAQGCGLGAVACVVGWLGWRLAGTGTCVDSRWFAGAAVAFTGLGVAGLAVMEGRMRTFSTSRTTLIMTGSAVLVALFSFAAFGGLLDEKTSGSRAGQVSAAAKPDTVAVIPVKGMTCGGCESHVSEVLRSVGGVTTARASAPDGSATVTFNSGKTSVKDMIRAINTRTSYKAAEQGTSVTALSSVF